MIYVDKNFYTKGLTMAGKGNRVMLNKDGETAIEMEFLGNRVKLTDLKGKKQNCPILIDFDKISEITFDSENSPVVILH